MGNRIEDGDLGLGLGIKIRDWDLDWVLELGLD